MATDTSKKNRNLMMYQVFVRNHTKDGTFSAIIPDLDRIKALGTDIVYLLPIHPIGKKNRKGSLGSPYAISDYRAINPEYGTLDDFKELVDAIHEKGMKCIMDVVYNHTSPDSVLVNEHPEWFYRKPDGSFGNRVGDWTDIIDLDYSNEGLVEYQIETLEYWSKFVDGFRCDVAPMVPIEFWEMARKHVEAIHPGFIWLAESIEKEFIFHLRSRGITALSDGEIFRAFDLSYDYDAYHCFTDYVYGRIPLSSYLDALELQEWIFPDNYCKIRFLENHDQTRAHFLIPDEKVLRNFTAFSFFQKGMAFVYAGQEFGATHLPSLFDLDTISLEPCDNIDMSDFIATLSKIKKDPIFADSTYRIKDGGNDICVATHRKDDRMALGVFSLKGKSSVVSVPINDGIYQNKTTGEDVEVFHGGISCKGEPIILII